MVVQRSSDFIAKVSDKATPLPYITAKNNDNIFTMRALGALIEDEDIDGLEYLVGKEDPDLEIALAKDPADMSPNEIALNIKIEHVLGCIIILILKHPLLQKKRWI
jgi:hypothetical protein